MIRDIYQLKQNKLATKADIIDEYTATIVTVGGSIWNNESKRLNWIQRTDGTGQPTPAYNRSVKAKADMVVQVQVIGGSDYPVIVDIPPELYATLQTALLPDHHTDHEPGGDDMLWLYTKAIVPLAVYPATTGLKINVISGYYRYSATRKQFAGAVDQDLSSSQPSSGQHRMVGLYLNASNALVTVNGTAVSTGTDAADPTWPAGALPLAVVDLDGDATSITFDVIHDRRAWLTYDSAGGGSGGYPFTVLTVDATDADADYSTISAAITAASSGDTILVGPGTYSETLSVNKAITIRGVSRERCIIAGSSAAAAATITGAAILENLTIQQPQDTQNAINITTTDGATLRDCDVAITATTGTGGYAINATVSVTVDNCRVTNPQSRTTRGVRVFGSGKTATIIGGSYDTETSSAYNVEAASSATAVLRGPTLVDGLITGTWTGWYFDANGDLHANGDAAGLFRRLVNNWQSYTINLNPFSGWTWASWLTTPSNVDTSSFRDLAAIWHTAAARHFAHRSTYSNVIGVRLSPARLAQIYSGLRMDDGTDNNYTELVVYTTTAGLVQYLVRYRSGGGSVTTTTLYSSQSFLPQFVNLLLARFGTTNYCYLSIDSPYQVLSTAVVVAGTYTNSGIFHQQTSGGSDNQSASLFDRYLQ